MDFIFGKNKGLCVLSAICYFVFKKQCLCPSVCDFLCVFNITSFKSCYLLNCVDFSEKKSSERRNHPDHHPHHRAGQDRQDPGGRLCHKPGCC